MLKLIFKLNKENWKQGREVNLKKLKFWVRLKIQIQKLREEDQNKELEK